MDDLMARTMVENLSIGINPITGEALSHWDCCSDELVQEALRTVLEHCTLESYASMLKKQREEREAEKKAAGEVSAAKRKSMYQNAGKPWTKADDARLKRLYFGTSRSTRYLSREMQRSPDSITSRLRKLGLIE